MYCCFSLIFHACGHVCVCAVFDHRSEQPGPTAGVRTTDIQLSRIGEPDGATQPFPTSTTGQPTGPANGDDATLEHHASSSPGETMPPAMSALLILSGGSAQATSTLPGDDHAHGEEEGTVGGRGEGDTVGGTDYERYPRRTKSMTRTVARNLMASRSSLEK